MKTIESDVQVRVFHLETRLCFDFSLLRLNLSEGLFHYRITKILVNGNLPSHVNFILHQKYYLLNEMLPCGSILGFFLSPTCIMD